MDSESPELPATERLGAVATDLAGAALALVRDPDSGRVRVEDYLTILAAACGEAVVAASGVIDVESNTLTPGAGIFGPPINAVLSGDAGSWSDVPAESALGILLARLVPSIVPLEAFGSLEGLFKDTAAHVGQAPWGQVTTSVPEANRPTILPLKAAFDLRGAVEAAQIALNLPIEWRHVPSANALAFALGQTRAAIDPGVAVTLSLEVLFAMSKMVPMPRSALEEVARTS